MKIVNYQFPKSSFLSLNKDLEILINLFLKNERLKKLLYYTTNDALEKKDIGEEASLELFEKNIKIVPKLYIDGSVLNYIIISFNNFTPNATNPEFRDNIISFDIICHFDQWQLQGTELRPYRIAAEIDTLLEHQRLTGIGQLEFLGANQLILNDEFAGISLMYQAIHGEEDKKDSLNSKDWKDIEKNFDKMFNV